MWNKIWLWLLGIAIIGGIASCNIALKNDTDRRQAANTIANAPVILVQVSDVKNYYTFFFDGFGNETWSKSYLRLNIDKSIPKGKPSALFEYNTASKQINKYRDIILSFHDREDTLKFMGGTMDIIVNSGRDSHVSVSNSNADSCFIATIGGY